MISVFHGHTYEHRARSMMKVPLMLFLWSTVGFLGGAIAQAGGGTKISADWTVDLRTVGAIAGIVLPATYWIARTITKTNDRLDAAEEWRKQHDGETTQFRREISAKLDSLPRNKPPCPAPKKQHH